MGSLKHHIKKIIKEEFDDFDWIQSSGPTIPDLNELERFCNGSLNQLSKFKQEINPYMNSLKGIDWSNVKPEDWVNQEMMTHETFYGIILSINDISESLNEILSSIEEIKSINE